MNDMLDDKINFKLKQSFLSYYDLSAYENNIDQEAMFWVPMNSIYTTILKTIADINNDELT